MALSPLTTWSSGQVLTALAENAEFRNIYNNALQLISPLTGNLNFAGFQLINARLENRTSSPTPGSVGRVYYNTGTNQALVDTGTKLVSMVNQGRQAVTGLKGTQSTSRNVATTMLKSALTFSADRYTFQTTDNQSFWQVVATSPVVVTLATGDGGAAPGPGGRDQAAAFSPGFVHIYALSSGQQSTQVTAVGSLNTPPNYPIMTTSNFPNQQGGGVCYIGTVPYEATSGMPMGFLVGDKWYYGNKKNILTSGQDNSWQSVSATGYVPSNALSWGVFAQAYVQVVSTGAPYKVVFNYTSQNPGDLTVPSSSPGGNFSEPNFAMALVMTQGGSTSIWGAAQATFDCPVLTSPMLQYGWMAYTGFSTLKVSLDLDVVSYRVENGA